MTATQPTVFHITHWRAGSQWVAEILKHVAPDRYVAWDIVDPRGTKGYGTPTFFTKPLKPGRIYGTVYLSQERFRSLVAGFFWRTREAYQIYPLRALTNWWNFGVRRKPTRQFLVIRDLRDTLVSLYFSTKYSHELSPSVMVERRSKLNALSEEEGLIYALDAMLYAAALIQSSWLGASDVLHLKYEDALGNEYAFFEKLLDYCQVQFDPERLAFIVRHNVFEAATGRKRGEEDVLAHLRKGIAGDWRNHFTDRVKSEFKRRYGQVLIDTGYEQGLDW